MPKSASRLIVTHSLAKYLGLYPMIHWHSTGIPLAYVGEFA